MSLLTILLLTACHSANSFQERTAYTEQLDVGESGPDWLVDSETYIIGPNVDDWDALAASKVAFVTHCPVNREFFERCHALGIRCFPYVTFYQGFAYLTYQGINLKDHPDFIEVDADGNLKRTGFWESEDAKNMYTTCPNVQAYQDVMVAWVTKLMELGADGVFVDNLGTRAECFGPKFGKHEHLYNDQNHAFAMLLKRVREVVKQFKPDGAVLGNSADPPSLPREFWKYLDAEMLESYICTWVSKERWFDWESHWHKAGVVLQDFLRAGKQIQALSYLGHTPYGIREDAFFCYASARLAGFVWSGGSPADPEVADLYRIRLGEPQSSEIKQNGVYFRVFERGMVVLNPDKDRPAELELTPPIPCRRLFDLFGGGASAWKLSGNRGYSLVNDSVHGGLRAAHCETSNNAESAGLLQSIELNQTEPTPIVVSAWSKSENVSGEPHPDYAIYVDIVYEDGTTLFGQAAAFDTGTHDWQFRTFTIQPEKAVKTATIYLLFRHKTGRVWFDDVLVESSGVQFIRNNGFEELETRGHVLDLTETGKLIIPKYSGRVYLFVPDNHSEVESHGPRLIVATNPPLGEVCFRVDGFDYWTHSGRWTTEYVLGPLFGKFEIRFDSPGTHTIEIVGVVPAPMKTPAGYGAGERLGQFMDPSNPTKPNKGRQFRFREWEGKGASRTISLDVSEDTTLTALFDVQENAENKQETTP